MNILTSKLFIKVLTWFWVEFTLNLVGLDNLADYTEFLTKPSIQLSPLAPEITLVLAAF